MTTNVKTAQLCSSICRDGISEVPYGVFLKTLICEFDKSYNSLFLSEFLEKRLPRGRIGHDTRNLTPLIPNREDETPKCTIESCKGEHNSRNRKIEEK